MFQNTKFLFADLYIHASNTHLALQHPRDVVHPALPHTPDLRNHLRSTGSDVIWEKDFEHSSLSPASISPHPHAKIPSRDLPIRTNPLQIHYLLYTLKSTYTQKNNGGWKTIRLWGLGKNFRSKLTVIVFFHQIFETYQSQMLHVGNIYLHLA